MHFIRIDEAWVWRNVATDGGVIGLEKAAGNLSHQQ